MKKEYITIDNEKSKIIDNEEKKNKNKIILKRVFAGLAALTVLGVGYKLYKNNQENIKAEEMKNISSSDSIDEDVQRLSSDLNFDPNNVNEIIDKVSELIIDASASGIKDISTVEYFDTFIALNYYNMTPEFLASIDFNRNRDEVVESFNNFQSKVMEDTLTVKSGTIFDIDSIISDKKSSELYKESQIRITQFNESKGSEKEFSADTINTYLEEIYVNKESKFMEYQPSVNVLVLGQYLSFRAMTKEESYAVPNKTVYNHIFVEKDKKCPGFSLLDYEQSQYKFILEDTLRKALAYKLSGVTNQTNNTSYDDIILLIEERVKKADPKFISNPELKISSKVSNKESSASSKTNSAGGGKTVLRKEPTESQKQQVIDETEEGLYEENLEAYARSAAASAGASAGNSRGFNDAENGNDYDDSISSSDIDVPNEYKSVSSTYISTYITNYKEKYKKGYATSRKPVLETTSEPVEGSTEVNDEEDSYFEPIEGLEQDENGDWIPVKNTGNSDKKMLISELVLFKQTLIQNLSYSSQEQNKNITL